MPFVTENIAETITPAESVRHDWQVEESRLAREYDLQVRERELEVAKLQAQWGSWLHLPKLIILLPFYCLLGLGFIAAMIARVEVGESFWQLIREI